MVAAMVAGPEEEMKSSRKYQSRPWFYLLQLFHADPRQRLKLAG
jgi:hypothetical protein